MTKDKYKYVEGLLRNYKKNKSRIKILVVIVVGGVLTPPLFFYLLFFYIKATIIAIYPR